jgi:hypothetical protein
MTAPELIQNFVRYYRKPFSTETVASFTSVQVEEVKPVLTELASSGKIKELCEGIFVKANRYNPNLCYGLKGTWKFDQQAANQLLNLIEHGDYTSIRNIAVDFHRSRQWVFVYLEALASIDAIGFDKVYYVKSRAHLKDLGKIIKKGILGELNPRRKYPDRKTADEKKADAAERRRLRQERDAALAKAREEFRAYKEAKKAEWEKIQAFRKNAHELSRRMAEDFKQRYCN